RQQLVGGQLALLGDCCEQRGANRLRQKQAIACTRGGVGQQPARIRPSGDRQAVLELLVDDGVPTDDEGARLVDLVLSSAENVAEDGQRQFPRWKSDDRQRGERLSAHCVDVGQRIRRGDLAEQVRIVDDRREKVDGLHERHVGGQYEDPRVVHRLVPYQQARIGTARQSFECLRQVTRTQLGGSTRATRERRE